MDMMDGSATLFLGPFAALADEFVEMAREAAELWLDTFEEALDSVAAAEEQAAGDIDVPWLATATRTQAKWIREMARFQLAMGRELLD
jgi:hypothetical protein